ncbi:MAG: hypothetical protein ACRC4N_04915 [Gammaproteobacteria bacterium]
MTGITFFANGSQHLLSQPKNLPHSGIGQNIDMVAFIEQTILEEIDAEGGDGS